MLIRDLQNEIVKKLKQKNVLCAENEAEILLLKVLKKDRLWLFLNQRAQVEDGALQEVEQLLAMRLLGRPLQYILNEAFFMGLSFSVDERVLIPRQDTELLAESAKEWLLEKNCINELSALDLCTGSGALAIFLKKTFPNLRVSAIDISTDALELAGENAQKNDCNNIEFLQSNLFSSCFTEFDLIVTNPPYIPTLDIETLQCEVRDFEPHLALDGGFDGLILIKQILQEAPKHLKPKGLLLMEIGDKQGDAVLSYAQNLGLYTNISIRKDFNNLDRMLYCVKL